MLEYSRIKKGFTKGGQQMRSTAVRRMILCIFTISILITVSNTTLAESVDMSKYTDDETISLLERIQGEVVSRSIEKTATIEA